MAVEIPEEQNAPVGVTVYTEEWGDYGRDVVEFDLGINLNALIFSSFINELRARKIAIPNGAKHKITPVRGLNTLRIMAEQIVQEGEVEYGTELSFVFSHANEDTILFVPEDEFVPNGACEGYLLPNVTTDDFTDLMIQATVNQARFN